MHIIVENYPEWTKRYIVFDGQEEAEEVVRILDDLIDKRQIERLNNIDRLLEKHKHE